MIISTFFGGRLNIKVGDITEETTDAIVNAANSTLLGGGGVDGAIHAKAGPELLDECRAIRRTAYPNGLPTGEAVITGAGRLPARYVIHTVGPVYGHNGERDAELLYSAYSSSIELAEKNNLASIAIPAISTGVYGYAKAEAALIAASAVADSLQQYPQIKCVNLVFYSRDDAEIFIRSCGLDPRDG